MRSVIVNWGNGAGNARYMLFGTACEVADRTVCHLHQSGNL